MIMTPQEKLNEIAHYDKCSYNSIARRSAMKMHEWDKQRFIEWAVDWIKNLSYGYLIEKYGDIELDREYLSRDFKKDAEEQL